MLANVFFDDFVGYVVRLIFFQIFPNSRNGIESNVKLHFLQCLKASVDARSDQGHVEGSKRTKDCEPGPDVQQPGRPLKRLKTFQIIAGTRAFPSK